MSPFALGTLTPEALLPSTPSGIDEQRRLAHKSPLEVAREFEAILVAQVIGAMRKTVSGFGLLGGGATAKILDGAFDQELARGLVQHAHLGLAEQLAAGIERHRDADARAAGSAADATQQGSAAAQTAAELVGGSGAQVTSGFGIRRDPITGAPAFHAGIDVAAPRGTAIHAVGPGEVVYSGRRGRAGNMVAIRHGDLVSTYAHVQRALVRVGQKVAAGDVLATVGSTGRSTGPHVHFAVTRDGQPVDPAAVLDAGARPAKAAMAVGDPAQEG
jgi:murein DD-endopeptidase MepM/ murein hydrolase activator NlpD